MARGGHPRDDGGKTAGLSRTGGSGLVGAHSVADYLGQLVQRGRQPDDAIQPRLSSRFEPPRQARVEAPALGTPVGRAPSRPADTSAAITGHESSRSEAPARQRCQRVVDLDASVDQRRRRASATHQRRPGGPALRRARRRDPEAGPASDDMPVRHTNRRATHTSRPSGQTRSRIGRARARGRQRQDLLSLPSTRAPQDGGADQPRRDRRSPDKPAASRTGRRRKSRHGRQSGGLETTVEPRQVVTVVPSVGREALRPSGLETHWAA